MELNNLTVLITRPRQQALPLAAALKNLGANPLIYSTLMIEPMHAELPDLNNLDYLIFISPNAVEYSVGLDPASWQLATGTQIISMGSGTSDTLKNYGINATYTPPAGSTSEDLLETSILKDVSGKKIILVTGRNSRPLLFEALTARGAEVDIHVVYQTRPPREPMPAWTVTIDVIIATSGEALKNLAAAIHAAKQEALFSCPLVLINPRMLELAKDCGFKEFILTQGASTPALIEGLTAWQHSKANYLKS